MVYEFLLPNVDPGCADEMTKSDIVTGDNRGSAFLLDTISFVIEGRIWKLRKLVHYENDILPVDIAYQQINATGGECRSITPVQHCCLQVKTDGLSEADACEIAEDICWLLQLPLGQKVSWDEFGYRSENGYQIRRQISVQIADKAQRNAPIKNEADGRLKYYLENAYPIYIEDRQWWRVTLDWIVIAYLNPVIQVTGLICSMLLERIPRYLLRNEAYPPQIGKDLAARIGKNSPERESVAKSVDQIFLPLAENWDPGRSEALLEIVLGWNAEPSYTAKMKQVFETQKMAAPSTSIMKNRSGLVHNGELKGKTDPAAYFGEIIRNTTVLLLRALGYRGRFFCLGVGEIDA